jgi:hypothetical protein
MFKEKLQGFMNMFKPQKQEMLRPVLKQGDYLAKPADGMTYGQLTQESPPNFNQQENAFMPQGQMPQNNSKNPYIEQMRGIFGDQTNDFDSILSWGDSSSGGAYGTDYGGENLGYDPQARNTNTDGSYDTGLFQINSNTFADFMRRHQNSMRGQGIGSYDDMYDPELNMKMAKLIQGEQGYGAWYGAPPHLRK